MQDLFNQMRVNIFHQNMRALLHDIAKLSTFLQNHKTTHNFSLSGTHIDKSTPTQLFDK